MSVTGLGKTEVGEGKLENGFLQAKTSSKKFTLESDCNLPVLRHRLVFF